MKCLKNLFASYRADQYSDPEGFTVNAKMVLAQYPIETIEFVTDARTGIQRKCTFPPSVKELVDACAEHLAGVARRKRYENWGKNDATLLEGPEAEKPTLEELKAKYGDNWGLDTKESAKIGAFNLPAPTWDEIVASYQADPSRLAALLKNDRDVP